jgi:adenosylcobinamide-GDP ribazoletransferase
MRDAGWRQFLESNGLQAALSRGRSALCEFKLALGFLTILPVAPAAPAASERVVNSAAYFSLVGFMLGVALVVEDFLLRPLIGLELRSILLVMSLALVTGCIHLDGLGDTADALSAGRDRERALAILRDSRIGNYGAIAIFFALLLKCVALANLIGYHRWLALYAAPGLARWVMIASSAGLTYLRAEGAGTALFAGGANKTFPCSLLALLALLPVISLPTLAGVIAAAIVAISARAFYRWWLGGISGDLIGAAGELSEVAVLLAVSACARLASVATL